MNKRLTATTLLILVLIPASTVLGPTLPIPLVHGLPAGIICITDPAFTGCQAAPANITALPGSTFTVAVNVFNSSSLNGFAISLRVNPNYLKPINASSDGSIIPTLPGNVFTANPVNCVNNGANGPPSNVGCKPSFDGNGTTTFSFLSVGGLSIAPTTGRLFEASYQAVGIIPSNGTNIGYVMTGTPTAAGTATCTGTSLANTCITITNGGTSGPTPESLAQIASFQTVTSDFSVSTSPSALTITQASSQTSTATLTTRNVFLGTVTLSTTTPSGLPVPSGLAVSFTPSTFLFPSVMTASVKVLVANATQPKSYSLLIVATSGSVARYSSLNVTVNGFHVIPEQPPKRVIAGTNSTNQVSISSSGFTGTVLLSVATNSTLSNRPTANITPKVVVSPSTPTATANLTISTTKLTQVGFYNLTITAKNMGGNITQFVSFIFQVVVPDFSLSLSPRSGVFSNTVMVFPGASNQTTVTIIAFNNFNGTVALSAGTVQAGISLTFNPNNLKVSQSNPSNSSTLVVSALGSVKNGTYPVDIIATNQTGVPKHDVFLTVVVLPGGFKIAGAPSTLMVQLGASNSSTITVYRVGNFNGTVTLSMVVMNTTYPSFQLSATTVILNSNSLSGTVMLNVMTTTSTATGTYLVTVTGQNTTRGVTVSRSVTITILIPDFSVNLSPGSLRIVLGVNQSSALSNITLTSLRLLAANVTLVTITTPAGNAPAIQLASKLRLQANKTNMTQLLVIATSNTPTQNYTITITATSGALTHTITINLEVIRPYVVMKTPILQTQSGTDNVAAGQVSTVYVQVANPTKVNATITVALDVYNGIGSSNLTVAHQDLNLQPGDNITVTLQWNTASYSPGKYNLYVRVISANRIIGQSTRVSSLTLNPAPQQTSQLPGGNGLWIAVAIIAVLAVGGYLYYLRRRRSMSQTRQPLGT